MTKTPVCQTADKEVWTVNGNTAICQLDEQHVMSVTREENGVRIKVKDYTVPEDPKVIFLRFIGDMQLGHIYRKK